jgi:hypothetical protein
MKRVSQTDFWRVWDLCTLHLLFKAPEKTHHLLKVVGMDEAPSSKEFLTYF